MAIHGERQIGKPPGETVREYKEADNPDKKLDEQLTVGLEQAAADLTAARNREENYLDLSERDELARAIDELRNGTTFEQLQQDAPQSVQQQPQVQEQPQADDSWQKYLQDPRILNAVQQHIDQANQQANQTIQAYNSAAVDAASGTRI